MAISTDNFVDSSGKVIFTGYQHARQLYLSDNYKNVPKVAFMYFVKFNVNPRVTALVTDDWDPRFTALLTRNITLPKFKISTETVNQYNRKTNIQTKIAYEAVTLELHDDRGGSTNGFWQNYYKYYYADSRYGDRSSNTRLSTAYADTKYSVNDYTYGLNTSISGTGDGQSNFLDSIDIFLLHQNGSPNQNDFTKITLINPLISSWDHDQADQTQGNKTMVNKMTVVYEDVIYETGSIVNVDSGVTLFKDPSVYDNTPTPSPNNVKGSVRENQYSPENDYVGKTYITTIPNVNLYRQQKKQSISIGQVLSSINQIKLLVQQPRQAWNVYGINVKNLLIGTAIGKISATQINLTSPANSETPQQGVTTKVTTFGTQGQQ
jgi:hypothetical protein